MPRISSGPNDSPVEAMKTKRRNSIAVGVELVRSGHAAAFLSAGSTGTVVAAASLGLPRLEGIRRPGICCTIEGEDGPFSVIDVGANPQPKPVHILHYALMGSAYYHDTFGVESPRVGLLNIGSEESKGSPLIKEASQLLRAANGIQFVGNVEGSDVFRGVCDVVVSDGFTGNVFLKVSEGVAEYMLRSVARLLREQNVSEEAQRAVIDTMNHRIDFSEYGGALLLGVDAIVTICHGRSRAPAIQNAIGFATRALGANVNEHIVNAAKLAAADA